MNNTSKRVDFKKRLARQGWFAELPVPTDFDNLPTEMVVTDFVREYIVDNRLVGGLREVFVPVNVRVNLHNDAIGCVKMMRTVIDRALLKTWSKDEEERQEALEWFNEKCPDFRMVCEHAYLKPDWVVEVALNFHDIFSKNKYCQYVNGVVEYS